MTISAPTIAVVDDDAGVRDSLQQLLRAADFRTVTYASAEAYLNGGVRPRVDCLILDINLPGMSGVALAQTLMASGDDTPIILITARDDPTTLELVRRAGSIPLLRKPFSEEELFDTIAGVLLS